MQKPSALIDTGTIVAVLERKDKWHLSCRKELSQLKKPLLTSEAVLAELFHLIPEGQYWMDQTWKFLRSGVIVTAPIASSEFINLHRLMVQYGDKPMDFADATLVYLAERESINTIVTVDSDFQTYRIHGTRKFRVLPAERP